MGYPGQWVKLHYWQLVSSQLRRSCSKRRLEDAEVSSAKRKLFVEVRSQECIFCNKVGLGQLTELQDIDERYEHWEDSQASISKLYNKLSRALCS